MYQSDNSGQIVLHDAICKLALHIFPPFEVLCTETSIHNRHLVAFVGNTICGDQLEVLKSIFCKLICFDLY